MNQGQLDGLSVHLPLPRLVVVSCTSSVSFQKVESKAARLWVVGV